MNDKIILKDKIQDFVNGLLTNFVVVAPMERKDAPAEFREIAPDDKPILDGSKMMMTPKDYLLPRYETLLKINAKKGEEKIESTIPEVKSTVMLGVWLADTQGIQVLDKVFLDEKFKDPYYAARRESLTLVAVVPKQIRWSWFSTSVDDVEAWKQKVDAVMYDLDNKFYIEFITEKGKAVADGALFTDPSDTDVSAKNSLWDNFKNMTRQKFADKALYQQLAWDDDVWDEIAQKCISCGMCAYMCPSCSCFDVQDETCGGCVERYRCRDTCQFEDFTLMGAGHNPRSQGIPRSRQRLLHKFKYQHEQFGIVGCTGCGRCIELCPVNIDIRDALNKTCTDEKEEIQV